MKSAVTTNAYFQPYAEISFSTTSTAIMPLAPIPKLDTPSAVPKFSIKCLDNNSLIVTVPPIAEPIPIKAKDITNCHTLPTTDNQAKPLATNKMPIINKFLI